MNGQSLTQCLLFADLFDKPVVARFDQIHGSSDGGAVLLKSADRRLGLLERLAGVLRDDRQPGKIEHELAELLAQRVTRSPVATLTPTTPPASVTIRSTSGCRLRDTGSSGVPRRRGSALRRRHGEELRAQAPRRADDEEGSPAVPRIPSNRASLRRVPLRGAPVESEAPRHHQSRGDAP